jgi:hypothetical protein
MALVAETICAIAEVEIDVLLEVDLLHRQAGQGLCLDVLDTVDVGADGILTIGGDALLHLGRAESGIAPDHRHHRNLDFGEDVRPHGSYCDNAEKKDQGGHHVERMRKSKREPNDAHLLPDIQPTLSRPSRARRTSDATESLSPVIRRPCPINMNCLRRQVRRSAAGDLTSIAVIDTLSVNKYGRSHHSKT